MLLFILSIVQQQFLKAIKLYNMKRIGIFLSMLLLTTLFFAGTTQAQEEWPKTITAQNGTVIKVYEPQPESFTGNVLKTRSAVSVMQPGQDDRIFGTMWAVSTVETDRDNRQVNIVSTKVPNLKFASQVDDLNNDGFPDVVMYAKSSAPNEKGYLYAISSEENRSFRPIAFPDITDDAKLSKGYRGHDEFSLLETTLMRKFPIYSDTDSTNQGPIGKRVVQYRLVNKEGRLTFIVLRSYEAKQ